VLACWATAPPSPTIPTLREAGYAGHGRQLTASWRRRNAPTDRAPSCPKANRESVKDPGFLENPAQRRLSARLSSTRRISRSLAVPRGNAFGEVIPRQHQDHVRSHSKNETSSGRRQGAVPSSPINRLGQGNAISRAWRSTCRRVREFRPHPISAVAVITGAATGTSRPGRRHRLPSYGLASPPWAFRPKP